MNKLKPCPFCGCKVVEVVDKVNFSYIECSGCLGRFYQAEACSVDDNVEAWNKRVSNVNVIQTGDNCKSFEINGGNMTINMRG